MLATAQESIRRAARALGYSDAQIEAFLKPDQDLRFAAKIGGKTYPAFRVQHSRKLGPYKGGIRFHPGVTIDEVQALATLMSIKTAAAGLPLGGGKGGIVVDPRELSAAELEELSRDYARQLAPHIGSGKDVPAPDVNTNSQIMDWMADEFEKITGETNRATFTGKSLANGGSQGRVAATGYGAVVVLAEYLKAKGLAGKPLTVAVQGFGNAGYYFAKGAQAQLPGLKIVAISNSKHTWVRHGGFDVNRTTSPTDTPRPEDLADAATAKLLPPEAILSQDADILVLAALEDALNDENVKAAKASIVVEVANGPVTDQAANVLFKKQVAVLPDVIVNAGGVIVSCLEWQQNLKHEAWSEEKVLKSMSQTLTKATEAMLAEAAGRQISLKQAAFNLALRRLMD